MTGEPLPSGPNCAFINDYYRFLTNNPLQTLTARRYKFALKQSDPVLIKILLFSCFEEFYSHLAKFCGLRGRLTIKLYNAGALMAAVCSTDQAGYGINFLLFHTQQDSRTGFYKVWT